MENNESKYPGNTIHPSAIIHPSVKMGVGNFIGAYAILEEKIILGDNNYIGPHCIIGDLGESVKFFDKEKKGVIIGNNNRFTKQITIDSGTENPTQIHNNTLWLKNAHAGHDCIVHDDVQVRCNGILGGHVTALKGSRVYLSALVHPRLTLPENCIIGMGSIVTKKTVLVDKGVYVGNPARLLKVAE
jgi:UDP-N-acetylglucosamine acyltransferase